MFIIDKGHGYEIVRCDTIQQVEEKIELFEDGGDCEVFIAVSHISLGKEHCDCDYQNSLKQLNELLVKMKMKKIIKQS